MGWLVFIFISSVFINEVMYNPEGNESGSFSSGDCNEFIELLNTGDDTVDLRGFFIADDDERDSLIAFQDSSLLFLYPDIMLSTKIPPGGYGLILDPEYTSSQSQAPQPYNIGRGAVVLTIQDSDIGNGLSSNDPIYLISSSGDTVDMDTSRLSTPDGFSRERRGTGPDNSFFLISRRMRTPGEINSWSYPVNLTLIDSVEIVPQFPGPGEPIILRVPVFNIGLETVNSFKILANIGESYDTIPYYFSIFPFETLTVEILLDPLPEGLNNIFIRVFKDEDDDTSGDFISLVLPVGESPLIINEIMYDEPEWIELYNRGVESINLKGLVVEDASGHRGTIENTFILDPDQYAVLTGDSSFKDVYPDVFFIFLGDFPSLNNQSETIELKLGGFNLETISYRGSWGGGNGVSLERISPELPGDERNNWTSSIDPRGATPGEENSVRKKVLEGGSIRMSSKILKEEDKFIIVEVNMENVEKTKYYILDSSGRVLLQNEVEGNVFKIDGKDDRGKDLGTGLYILYVEAKAGKKLFRFKKTFVIAH